jgi:uncharacterized heparinase superfamily protein
LIENLQRREIDPIDKATAILAFFRNRHGEMACDKGITNCVAAKISMVTLLQVWITDYFLDSENHYHQILVDFR